MSSSFEISGSPTPEEEAAVVAAVERLLRDEDRRRKGSAWKMSGRSAGIRGGVIEARHRLGRRSWGLSERLPIGGPEPPYLSGRGDAK